MGLIPGRQASVSAVSSGHQGIFQIGRHCKTYEVRRKEWTKFVLIAREAETYSQLRNMGQSADVVIAMRRHPYRDKHSLKLIKDGILPLKMLNNICLNREQLIRFHQRKYGISTETVTWNSEELVSNPPSVTDCVHGLGEISEDALG